MTTTGFDPAVGTVQSGHWSAHDTRVLDQDGQAYRSHDDLIRDRVMLINFFFQSYGEVCPLVSENLRTVQDELGERMGRDIFMYSITLQPQFDRPHILKAYAQLRDVKPGWKFPTGGWDHPTHVHNEEGLIALIN